MTPFLCRDRTSVDSSLFSLKNRRFPARYCDSVSFGVTVQLQRPKPSKNYVALILIFLENVSIEASRVGLMHVTQLKVEIELDIACSGQSHLFKLGVSSV